LIWIRKQELRYVADGENAIGVAFYGERELPGKMVRTIGSRLTPKLLRWTRSQAKATPPSRTGKYVGQDVTNYGRISGTLALAICTP